MPPPKEPLAPKLTAHNPLLSPDGKARNTLFVSAFDLYSIFVVTLVVDSNHGYSFQSKRGSFLSRGDGVLAKLAKITGSSKENVMSGAKSRGNFVFSAISPPKKEIQSEEDFDSKVG